MEDVCWRGDRGSREAWKRRLNAVRAASDATHVSAKATSHVSESKFELQANNTHTHIDLSQL